MRLKRKNKSAQDFEREIIQLEKKEERQRIMKKQSVLLFTYFLLIFIIRIFNICLSHTLYLHSSEST